MTKMKLDWAALMRLGLRDLGLSPDAFWRLTPAEFMVMVEGGHGVTPPMKRDRFRTLMAKFPDGATPHHFFLNTGEP